jgi:lysophospholipase L1-like esterase
MLKRLGRDVLSKKPDWMLLSCGVNDVWHGPKGVPLDQFKTNIAAIVDQCQSAGIQVMILTTTVIGEDLGNDLNAQLAPYNDFLRRLAREKHCLLADLNRLFREAIERGPKSGDLLTTDGTHLNEAGNRLMAEGILRAFGVA